MPLKIWVAKGSLKTGPVLLSQLGVMWDLVTERQVLPAGARWAGAKVAGTGPAGAEARRVPQAFFLTFRSLRGRGAALGVSPGDFPGLLQGQGQWGGGRLVHQLLLCYCRKGTQRVGPCHPHILARCWLLPSLLNVGGDRGCRHCYSLATVIRASLPHL